MRALVYYELMEHIDIPQSAQTILDLIEAAGYEAYVVGGCVRDALLGCAPNDWDITTSARPDQIKSAMACAGLTCVDTGIAHGTITVLVQQMPFEVTTYRSDGTYSDGRHPDSVAFLEQVDGDLARRDFTVNAMAYNSRTGIVDRFGGRDDLAANTLRAVGDARMRFSEDALRIVRGLRFAAMFGFEIETRTAQAMHELRGLLAQVAVERIWAELAGMLCGAYAVPVIRAYSDVIFSILPELEPEYGFDQHNPFHRYDVWEHTLHAFAAAGPDMSATVRFALLIHDIGKPHCLTFDENGRGHTYGHDKVGEPIARELCERLKLPKAEREQIVHLVRWHMFSIPDTEKSMRRFLLRHGVEGARQLFELRRCDKLGLGRGPMPDAPLSIAFRRAEALMDEQLAARPVLSVKDLAVNGHDLIGLGIEQGPEIGALLQQMLLKVVDGELPNNRAALLGFAQTAR